MNDAELLHHVHGSAAALGLSLDHERARRVAGHWAHLAQLAQSLLDAPIEPHDEPAEIYRPAPFPQPGLDEGP